MGASDGESVCQVSVWDGLFRPLGYERVYLPRVYLPLFKVADTPFHFQGNVLIPNILTL